MRKLSLLLPYVCLSLIAVKASSLSATEIFRDEFAEFDPVDRSLLGDARLSPTGGWIELAREVFEHETLGLFLIAEQKLTASGQNRNIPTSRAFRLDRRSGSAHAKLESLIERAGCTDVVIQKKIDDVSEKIFIAAQAVRARYSDVRYRTTHGEIETNGGPPMRRPSPITGPASESGLFLPLR